MRIRRLSIDAACANGAAIDPHDLGGILGAALSERLGAAGADDDRPAAVEQPTSLGQTVANAVASRVQPLLGEAGATEPPRPAP